MQKISVIAHQFESQAQLLLIYSSSISLLLSLR